MLLNKENKPNLYNTQDFLLQVDFFIHIMFYDQGMIFYFNHFSLIIFYHSVWLGFELFGLRVQVCSQLVQFALVRKGYDNHHCNNKPQTENEAGVRMTSCPEEMGWEFGRFWKTHGSWVPTMVLRSWCPTIVLRSWGPTMMLRSWCPTMMLRSWCPTIVLRSWGPTMMLRSWCPTIVLRSWGPTMMLRSWCPPLCWEVEIGPCRQTIEFLPWRQIDEFSAIGA